MSSGEKAAIEGLVAQLAPRLALEIGAAEGASTQWLAERVEEVHTVDLSPPQRPLPENVVVHTGDSHEILPELLASLASQGRNVDLALVDGDHSATGVRQDLEDLLGSPALGRSAILIHDVANERVRAGLDAVRFGAWPKVAYVHLDWVPGQLFREPGLEQELWYGLGLVLVDATRQAYGDGEVFEQRYFPNAPLLVAGRDAGDGGAEAPPPPPAARTEVESLRWELAQAREQLDQQNRTIVELVGSASWRATAPLRKLSVRLGRIRARLFRGRRRDANRARLG
jgi:hypothetical protein